MTSLADVFTDQESTNWLKAWLAVDITKAGLERFVHEEVQNVHSQIFNCIRSKLNLLATESCPTPGMCKKRSNVKNQIWHCPIKLCDEVHYEIIRYHRYGNPSWKNTSADQWASNPWQIAKCYLPPDGYTDIHTVQDTDFNGVISVLLNCLHFDNKVSFSIQPSGSNVSCLLTKARDIGKALRHSSKCKVTITDLQDYFTTLTTLLSDPKFLAQDCEAQKAIKKLKELQNESLTIAERDLCVLLVAANKVLTTTQEVDERARKDIEKYITRLHVKEKEFIRLLKKHYNTTLLYNVIDSSDIESQIKSIKEIYATPKIHRIQNFERACQVFTYKDIFYTDGKSNSRIFLKGEAGTGKSTFAVKLVLDWCRDSKPYQETSENEKGTHVASDYKIDNAVPSPSNTGDNPQEPTEITIYERQRQPTLMFDDTETLMEFQCVFLVTLREFDKETEVVEMIKKQIVDTMYAKEDRQDAGTLLQEIMKKENCLVIQDGLDEWTGEMAVPLMLVWHNQCTVLTTTRPWKMTDERIKHIDNTLELNGLNDPYALSSIIIERRCKKRADVKKAKFLKYIEKNYSLKDLLSSPMLLKLIVYMWLDGIKLSGSVCEIYSILLDNLFKKVTASKGYFHPPPVLCFERTKYIKPNIAYFNVISKMAFSMLFTFKRQSSLVFSEGELSIYLSEDQKIFACNAGILSERKGNTLSNSCTSCFVHKSVQEFCAAYHIAMNAGVIDETLAEYIEQFGDTDLKQVYVFLTGMNEALSGKLLKLINAKIEQDAESQEDVSDRTATGAFRPNSSNKTSDKVLQLKSLRMAGIKEAEAVKRIEMDKHGASRLVHSVLSDNHMEGWLSIAYTHNIIKYGWRLQYVKVTSRKVLFYSSEADKQASAPMLELDIEKLYHVRSVTHGDFYWEYAEDIRRIFEVLYTTECENRETEDNPGEINIKFKTHGIYHKGHLFKALHVRRTTTSDSCSKPMWHMVHPPNVMECIYCHLWVHKDMKDEYVGYCKVKALLLLADSEDDQQTWVTHLSKKISTKDTVGQGTLGTPTHDHGYQTSAANKSNLVYTPNQVQKMKRYNAKLGSDTRTCNISGIYETSSGELLITDMSNKNVKLLDSTFKVVDHLDLPDRPRSMCSIDGNTVAIVVGYDRICFIKLTNGQLVQDRTLKLEHRCECIAHRQGTMYISTCREVFLYNVDGVVTGKIYEKRGITSCAVSPDGDTIYLVKDHKTLITLSSDGRVISKLFAHKLYLDFRFVALHVTGLGQVLVCGGWSPTILQVDKDGRHKLAMLTERDCVWGPSSVYYSIRTGTLFVAMYGESFCVFTTQ